MLRAVDRYAGKGNGVPDDRTILVIKLTGE